MTNDTPPTPFIPPPTFSNPQGSASGYDFFQSNAPYDASRPPSGRNSFQAYRLQEHPNVIRWDLYIEDLSDGLDLMQTRIDTGYVPNKLADSNLEHRYPYTLCLLPLEESDTTASKLLVADENLSSATLRADDAAVIFAAGGSTANQALFALGQNLATGAMEVTAKTYSPASVVEHIAVIHIATVIDRMCIMRVAGAPQILSAMNNVAPTVDGTMNANLNPGYAVVRSPLNAATPGAETLLFLANSTLYSLTSTAAIGDAPTAILTNVPNGSYLIGVIAIPGSPPRIYIGWPEETLSVSVLEQTNDNTFQIVSVNLEGTDPQRLDIGLDFCIHAKKYREGVIATDGQTIIWQHGLKQNLGALRERVWQSGMSGSIVTLEVVEARLLAFCAEVDSASVVQGRWIEEYIPENDAWYRVSAKVDPGAGAGTTTPVLATTNNTPVLHYHAMSEAITYHYRLFWYQREVAGWKSISILPLAVNPFRWQNAGESFRFFTTTGTARMPIYHFFSGFPKCVSDMWSGAELPATTNLDSSVEYEFGEEAAMSISFTGNPTLTFRERDRWDRRYQVLANPHIFDRLQMQITVNQGTGANATRTTPNALPFRVGGYVALDGEMPPISALEPWRWLNR